MTISNTSLYEAAVAVSEDFLGPAGERFIRRQISTHFEIEPERLKPRHLPELIDWVRLTFGVLTSDKTLVDDFAERLHGLSTDFARNTKGHASLKG